MQKAIQIMLPSELPGKQKASSSAHCTETHTPSLKEKVGLQSFVTIKLLGKGSFGEVYLVRKRSTGILYAMKVLSKDKVRKQNLTRYAMTENNVLRCIQHPFIVRLHCAFQTSAKLMLIIDYCPGGDLGDLLKRQGKLQIEQATIYASEILLALEELHKREIIYRDLKPDNVLLDGSGHAVLADFGLSKEGINFSDITTSFCGSYAYLAPEVLARAGHGRSVDWYLFGVLLFEMLVGSPPFYHEDK